jgi:hypothetical protein
VATIQTFASVASVASAASFASVETVATVAPVVDLPTVPSFAITPKIAISPDPVTILPIGTVDTLQNLIAAPLVPTLNFNLAPNVTVTQGGLQNVSADSVRDRVTSTRSGALIPLSASSVQGSGAPLLSISTVKVDPQDTGGANGQVVSSTSILQIYVPGLLSEGRPSNRGSQRRFSLADQPSTMNDEPVLD